MNYQICQSFLQPKMCAIYSNVSWELLLGLQEQGITGNKIWYIFEI